MPRKKPDEERVTTAVRFPKTLHLRLHEAANARELSANFLIVKAVEQYLERLIPSEEFRLTRD
jgi:predicted HicB family RNase H-like nuclease